MIRQVIIGIISGVVAVLLLASLKRDKPPTAAPRISDVRLPALDEFVPLSASTETLSSTVPSTLDNVIQELAFHETPLVDVFDSLRKASGLNIVVSWDFLGGHVGRDTLLTLRARDVSVEKALWLVCDAVQDPLVPLGFEVHQGIVRVGPVEFGISPRLVTQIYDVRDLMIKSLKFRRAFDAARPPTTAPRSQWPSSRTPPPTSIQWSEEEIAEDLYTTIMATVDRDSWVENGGRFGSIRYCFGLMIIDNTRENHAQIERFLTQLRQHWASTP